MKIRINKFLLPAAFIFSASIVHAATTATGTVERLIHYTGGRVLVELNLTNQPNLASCNTVGEFTVSVNDVSGRTQLAALLSAQMEYREVSIRTTGDCTFINNREDVRYVATY